MYFIDYGNTETLRISDIQPLNDKFKQLPPQAVCCALHRVDMTRDSLATFIKISEGKSCVVRVEGNRVHNGEDMYAVTMFRTVNGKDYNINDIVAGRSVALPPDETGAIDSRTVMETDGIQSSWCVGH